ncbi:MAG: 1-acyl-sn-glycerol-3-phosphate acyltransferase [Planctomycetes bacterium]|nr:1-acyl-sn-glycerol-3-phosphate acyltransferase [Planctomycetota bacterium]
MTPPREAAPDWYAARTLTRLLGLAFWRMRAYGTRNVPARGGVLVAATHQSFLDPPLVGSAIPRPSCFMARSDLFRFGPFGAVIRRLHAFPVRQGGADRGAIDGAIALLREGRCLIIFPEGGRTRDGRVAPIQQGFSLVARRAGVPIVPARVWGTFRAWPWFQPLPRPSRVAVAFAPPLDMSLDRAGLVEGLRAAWDDLGRLLGPEPRVRASRLARALQRRASVPDR